MYKQILIMLLSGSCRIFGQSLLIDMPITVSDNDGGRQELHIGLAASATDSLDSLFSEEELPPCPMSGIFDARLVGEDIGILQLGQGSYRDYRQGDHLSSGSHTFELKYQVGSGDKISISWILPEQVTGNLQDLLGGLIINQTMSGAGSLIINNPAAINKIKVTIFFKTISTVDYGLQERKETEYLLPANYPNPFNNSTRIVYKVQEPADVNIQIMDTSGRIVRHLMQAYCSAGVCQMAWDGKNDAERHVASGLYFCIIQYGGNRVRGFRMSVLK